MDALLDGPLEPGQECRSLAAQIGTQHAHRIELDLGRQADDDARARRGVAVQVDRLVGHDRRLVVDDLDGHGSRPAGRGRQGGCPRCRCR